MTQVSGQISFTEKELDNIFRRALETLAENTKLKSEIKADSIAIAALKESLKEQTKAREQAQVATEKAVEIGQTFHAELALKDKELGEAKREIKRQSLLKWLALLAGVAAVVATN